MEKEQVLRIPRLSRDWTSKLTDGVFTAILLISFWVAIALVVRPIQALFGISGLLVYGLVLLAVSMISLQQSILSRHVDATRAWFGMASGVLCWAVVQVCSSLGAAIMPNMASVIFLIMVTLIVWLLWRSVFPLGIRFFSMTFLLNWTGYAFLNFQEWLAQFSPIFTLTYQITGYLAIFGAVLIFCWMLFQARRRIQRIGGALAVWFLFTIAMYVFRGPLF